jgi:hypothetical protein
MIAKTGEKLRWHWAHEAADSPEAQRCEARFAPMSDWHWEWQQLFPGWQEKFEKNAETGEVRRADVYVPSGVIVEFQRSALKDDLIEAREVFWTRGDRWLIWVLDGATRADAYKYGWSSDRVIALTDNKGVITVGGQSFSREGFAAWLSSVHPSHLGRMRDAARKQAKAGLEELVEYARRTYAEAQEMREAGEKIMNERQERLASAEAALSVREQAAAAMEAELAAKGVHDVESYTRWRDQVTATAEARKAEAEAAVAEAQAFAEQVMQAATARAAELDIRGAELDAIDPAERDRLRTEITELSLSADEYHEKNARAHDRWELARLLAGQADGEVARLAQFRGIPLALAEQAVEAGRAVLRQATGIPPAGAAS